MHVAQSDAHVRQKAVAVTGQDVDSGLKALLGGVLGPFCADPTLPLGGVLQGLLHVDAIPLVDGNPIAPGDKADDLVPGQRVAALGKLDQAAVQPLHDDPAGSLLLFGLLKDLLRLTGSWGRYCRL